MTETPIHKSEEDIAQTKTRLQTFQPDEVRVVFNDYFNLPDDDYGEDDYSWELWKILKSLSAFEHNSEPTSDFNGEQVGYENTPYNIIKRFLKLVQPREGDVVYDLGCGFGDVVIMGALTHPTATFKGIEFVSGRVQDANEVRERLGLENAQIIHGNVRDVDFSDGNIFYMFNPFTHETLSVVIGKLEARARKGRILIGSFSASNNILEIQPWLRDTIPVEPGSQDLRVFESSWPEPFFPERLEELQGEIAKLGYLERGFTRFQVVHRAGDQ